MQKHIVQKVFSATNGSALKATYNLTTVTPNSSEASYLVPWSYSHTVLPAHSIAIDEPKCYTTYNNLATRLPVGNGWLRAISGMTVKSQVRCFHTDVKIPDGKKIRRGSTMDPTEPARESRDRRRAFTYLATSGAVGLTAYAAKTAAVKFFMMYWYNQDVSLGGIVEFDLNKVPLGGHAIVKWQGKPIFVKHRTQEEIDEVRRVDHTKMRDPQSDEDRVKVPEWLVTIGVCTHLGCVPMPNSGENFGGYYCPCHGSHYDASGRVTNGPAPNNLELPQYSFANDHTILIG